ncbi:MAG: AmmeMemoRadiSam system protein B, partial [Candidatus Binatia bacterium]
MASERSIQPSQVAGTWYPGEAERLVESVDRLIAGAGAGPDERVRAMIVPHAGYQYSGRAAAAGYARLPRRRWRRAAILAPSHHHLFEGAAVFPGRGFETPLGVVEIDAEAARRLESCEGFSMTARPYAREHSLEIQLPFLQRRDPALRVVPILVGAADPGAEAVGAGLRALDDGDTFFVVSSDFTHYGAAFDYLPFPPSGAESVAAALRELDFGAIDRICRLDADGFGSYVRLTGATICGRAPIAAFLASRPRGLAGTVASYYTSLDVTGDYEHSVSY